MAPTAGVFGRFSHRRRGFALVAVPATALALGACGTGSGDHFKDIARPPVPVDLSVYVDNSHVSISPARVGAGPVILIITNQASGSQTVAIKNTGGRAIASSGHINSGQTAQITADLKTGSYTLATGAKVSPATLKIGKARQNADNVLLQP